MIITSMILSPALSFPLSFVSSIRAPRPTSLRSRFRCRLDAVCKQAVRGYGHSIDAASNDG